MSEATTSQSAHSVSEDRSSFVYRAVKPWNKPQIWSECQLICSWIWPKSSSDCLTLILLVMFETWGELSPPMAASALGGRASKNFNASFTDEHAHNAHTKLQIKHAQNAKAAAKNSSVSPSGCLLIGVSGKCCTARAGFYVWVCEKELFFSRYDDSLVTTAPLRCFLISLILDSPGAD